MDRLRVGLVGGGPWARRVHGPSLAAHEDVELAGVWTRRPEAAAELAAEFDAPAAPDLDALLADVDAVALAVPPVVQGELAVRAAAAGVHLICEKPLAADLTGARAVADAVARAGVLSSVVLVLRHDPRFAAWVDAVRSAAPGPDTVGSARWLSGSLLGGTYRNSAWRAENGALLDLGPHVVDLLDAALGRVVDVEWAQLAERDLWRFALLHEGGARSTVVTSLRLPVDPSEIELAVFGGAGSHVVAGRARDALTSYANLVDELVAAIRGDGPPPVLDAARGLHLQEVLHRVQTLAAHT